MMPRWLSHFIHFLAALIFIGLGGLGIILPLFPELRQNIAQSILDHFWSIATVGLALIFFGMLEFFTLFRSKRYYKVSSIKEFPITVDKTLLDKYIATFWQKTFPNDKIDYQLEIKNKKLIIFAEFPFVPEVSRANLMNQIHKDLEDILSKILGYSGKFELSIKFKKAP